MENVLWKVFFSLSRGMRVKVQEIVMFFSIEFTLSDLRIGTPSSLKLILSRKQIIEMIGGDVHWMFFSFLKGCFLGILECYQYRGWVHRKSPIMCANFLLSHFISSNSTLAGEQCQGFVVQRKMGIYCQK